MLVRQTFTKSIHLMRLRFTTTANFTARYAPAVFPTARMPAETHFTRPASINTDKGAALKSAVLTTVRALALTRS